MSKFYAGIGSRQTPPDIMQVIRFTARKLADNGWHLRSGGARGADSAFETGSCFACDSYKPDPALYDSDIWEAATSIAADAHPAWNRCGDFARRLHTRNVFQILGHEHSSPRSRFVLCWTPDACEDGRQTTRATGGTGQALRIATRYNIPIYNLCNPQTLDRIQSWIG